MTFEEIKQSFVGRVSDPIVFEVEKGSIKRYAEAVGSFNPLYLDEEYAKDSRYGTIIAPPGFLGWPVKPGPMFSQLFYDLFEALREIGYPNQVDGGIEMEFSLPVRAGDILVSIAKLVDVVERERKGGGNIVFGVVETTYHNQNGQLVTKIRQTGIGSQ